MVGLARGRRTCARHANDRRTNTSRCLTRGSAAPGPQAHDVEATQRKAGGTRRRDPDQPHQLGSP
eukprot:10356555-Alexandrium_andersonii.AAC.1